MLKRLLFTWPYLVGLEYAVLTAFGVPRFAWRFIGLREATRVLQAMALVTAAAPVARLLASQYLVEVPAAQYVLVPIGVNGLNFALGFLAITGVRALRRIVVERASVQRLQLTSAKRVPTLLVGAGQAGALVARELEKRPDLGIEAVGFLDDERNKTGTMIHGIAVLGTTEDMAKYAAHTGARQALVTIADMDPSALRRIVKQCEIAGLPAKLLPGLYQVIEGQMSLGRLRDVSIEDLLGRESVSLNMAQVSGFLRQKRVLVTGAGGSIGSELCRQVARFGPSQLILVERAEFALFTIEQELRRTHPSLTLLARICDVCDTDRLDAVFGNDRPQVVFHAAAHKHVPMMEYNPGEALKNNVFGTKAVADCADRHAVENFVLISTDKAVNPSSIMGATKRVAEMYVQAISGRSSTKYVAVRFGNVLGSAGSVVPIFKEQIANGGPVTVTHPEMQRYFMTIPEASQLVMQAAAMGNGGEIFVLDMGEPVKIVDLANDLIRLSGLVPDVDIKIEFGGTRPGEKLFEEIGVDTERMTKTTHPKIFIGRLAPISVPEVATKLERLQSVRSSMSADEVRSTLKAVVPEMLTDNLEPGRGRSQPPRASKVQTVAVPTNGPVSEPELSDSSSLAGVGL